MQWYALSKKNTGLNILPGKKIMCNRADPIYFNHSY